MKTIIEGNKEEKVQMSNKYIEEEKNNLFMNKPKKKFFNYDRKRRIKKVFRTLFIIITLVIYIGVLVVIGKSADYHFNTIYDEYEELDKLAVLMLNPNENFSKLQEIWNNTSKFRIMSGALN